MNLDILLVDDEPQVLRMFKRVLQRDTTYSIETAADSKTAIELALAHKPRLLLMDVHLASDDPLSGVLCVSQLRSVGYSGLICMMTGDSSEKKLLDTAMAGADDYLLKDSPLDFSAEIKQLFQRQEKGCDSSCGIPLDSFYLRSFGLEPHQIELLVKWHASDYLAISKFAIKNGLKKEALSKRFKRIREKLKLDNNIQLVRLLTAISLFETRRKQTMNLR